MLKLRDFIHLPQLDQLMNRVVRDSHGLILLAGIETRTGQFDRETDSPAENFTPSGLSAMFNILIQEILLAQPEQQAVVVAEDRHLSRVPRQLQRRVAFHPVQTEQDYARQIEMSANQHPGMLIIDHLNAQTAPAIFQAASQGELVLAQFDTILHGASVLRQIIDLGIPRGYLTDLRWVITMQRLPALCSHCKRAIGLTDELCQKVATRYPHLREVLDQLKRPSSRSAAPKKALAQPAFFRAQGCERCHGSGYQGDIAIFDLFHNNPLASDPLDQSSLLSLEEYALHLASHGQIDLYDLLELDSNHVRRIYQMRTTSERALKQTNTELSRKLLELEASNRVLVQRTEVLVSLQELGQTLISSTGLSEVATWVCRRAGDLCSADRVVLYLRKLVESGKESAEVLAVRGWEGSAIGYLVPPAQVFDGLSGSRPVPYMHSPPGVRPIQPRNGEEGNSSLRSMGLRVPLVAQEQLVGVMIIQSTQKESFHPGETALLQAFANQAALAIQRTSLIEELRAKITQLEAAQAELVVKERIERELELAHQVQESMLPHSFPVVPGYTLTARYEPARQVGGDFYDMFVLDDDHFGIVVADVADKGLPAALYMALTRSLLLAEARRERSPRTTLQNVNTLLLDLGELNGFVSVFYGVVECSSHRLVYARAGHERPLLLRADQIHKLGGRGTVLGIQESNSLNLSEEEHRLEPGDRIILYSDGLCDVMDESGTFLGLDRLQAIVADQAELPIEALSQAIFDLLAQFRGQAEQFDDMTLLALEVSLL